ncbi:hypothetical protein B0T18DRAFT_133192 [Schizothecium vesticola]|uniref:Uncharacterized protein n=1 Tax=Schizothecium vesticola TaxID=314040 RepID=A0AA40EU81_9PEZI|nr:hypothetical protein B0T18DRAFT_133192 [Schizothecium vesticola]
MSVDGEMIRGSKGDVCGWSSLRGLSRAAPPATLILCSGRRMARADFCHLHMPFCPLVRQLPRSLSPNRLSPPHKPTTERAKAFEARFSSFVPNFCPEEFHEARPSSTLNNTPSRAGVPTAFETKWRRTNKGAMCGQSQMIYRRMDDDLFPPAEARDAWSSWLRPESWRWPVPKVRQLYPKATSRRTLTAWEVRSLLRGIRST